MRPEEVVTAAIGAAGIRAIPVYLSEDENDVPEIYAIYAATGETVDETMEGNIIRAREFRVELHSARVSGGDGYMNLLEPDDRLVRAFISSRQFRAFTGMFDDWSEGRQPTLTTERARIPLEMTPKGVYRRTRTVEILL